MVGMERLLRLAEWREEPDSESEVEEKVWEERPEMVQLGISSEVTMSGTGAERDGGLGCFHLTVVKHYHYFRYSFQILLLTAPCPAPLLFLRTHSWMSATMWVTRSR